MEKCRKWKASMFWSTRYNHGDKDTWQPTTRLLDDTGESSKSVLHECPNAV